MFFTSNRPGGFGGDDIWASWRTNIGDDVGWQPPVNLGPGANSAVFDAGRFDGLEIIFFSKRPGADAGSPPGFEVGLWPRIPARAGPYRSTA